MIWIKTDLNLHEYLILIKTELKKYTQTFLQIEACYT